MAEIQFFLRPDAEREALESGLGACLQEYGEGLLGEERIVVWDGRGLPPSPADFLVVVSSRPGVGGVIEADLVLHDPSPAQLWAGLMALISGLTSGQVLGPLARDQPVKKKKEGGAGKISAKERLVLERLAAGEPNKAIAYGLGISLSTVKFHVKNLMSKTAAASRTEMVMEAARRGWISL